MTNATSLTAEGGCLCGAVRYRVAGAIEESGYCHCRTCQRQSGAPVVAWFAVAPSAFQYTKGAPKIFQASNHAGREFCGNCATYLVFREDDASLTVSVNTATLDEPMLAPPEFHIYCESRIGWFETDDALPRHARGKGA
jgi:hypothetical protein